MLLATIVLVTARGVGERGRIAGGLRFSQHLLNSLGADAVGRWSFDEGSGTTANDMSGWHNHGTLQPALSPPTWQCVAVDPNNTPSRRGCSLRFDGENDFVEVADSPALRPTHALTVEVWIHSNTTQSHNGASVVWKGETLGYSLVPTGNNVHVVYGGTWGALISPMTHNVWQHWVFTYDNMVAKLYRDGVVVASRSDLILGSDTRPLWIGRRGDHLQHVFNGLIDEVRIYNRALTSVQIQSKYYAGLQNLLARGLINQEEYQQRLTNRQ